MANTGRVTGFGDGRTTGNATGRETGGLEGQWWELERQAVILANQAQQQGGFQITSIPTRPERLFFFGTPITGVQQQLAGVISQANALLERILEAGDVQVTGPLGGVPFLGMPGFGVLRAAQPQGLPSLQDQTDAATTDYKTRGLTLADQRAGGKPFDGVPRPLRKQLRGV